MLSKKEKEELYKKIIEMIEEEFGELMMTECEITQSVIRETEKACEKIVEKDYIKKDLIFVGIDKMIARAEDRLNERQVDAILNLTCSLSVACNSKDEIDLDCAWMMLKVYADRLQEDSIPKEKVRKELGEFKKEIGKINFKKNKKHIIDTNIHVLELGLDLGDD